MILALVATSAGAAESQSPPAPSAVSTAKQTYDNLLDRRMREGLSFLQSHGWPSPAKNPDFKQHMALLLLFMNERVDEANRMILEYCGLGHMTTYVCKPVPKNRPEELFRAYLMERTYRLLSPEARTAIEDYAWETLVAYNRGITFADAQKSFWEFDSTENHYVNDRRRTTLVFAVVRKSERYGPEKMFEGHRVEDHYQAWVRFWIRYFRARAGEGTDLEIAHQGSYGLCTVGVYYDLYDLIDNAELRELAGKFLTLYWAEVAAEFEPRTGNRAWAQTRMPQYYAIRYWARSLLYCYQWHDHPWDDNFLGMVPFLVSDYRPPQILSAIARDPDRGCYLSTSRRAGMVRDEKTKGIVFDANGDGHFRRDVWYTPDYTLSTMTLDPSRDYDVHITLGQTQGATFAADVKSRITVLGTGYYANRATIGVTGRGVSIVARDLKAEFGLARFKSNGTRVFISNGPLWNNRIEDPSGWFFTRCGDAYVAIRVPGPGVHVTNTTYIWPNRHLKEVKETHGHFLELNDMWVPVVIQMGRAVDYENFKAFQSSVKENTFTYEEGKLTYTSEAGDTYEAWAKFPQLPKINVKTLNLNPKKTYDSPFLSMEHGSDKAVIRCPGHDDVILEFCNESQRQGDRQPRCQGNFLFAVLRDARCGHTCA